MPGMSEPSWDRLRPEYDAAVLDPAQRAARARRVRAALTGARLWPSAPRILDVACGSGLLLAALDDRAGARVGCDVRRELYLRVRDQIPGVRFTQADAARLPFRGGSFDLVTCMAAIEEFPDWRTALAEMARCVAPGGVLYVTVTNGAVLRPLYALARSLGRHVPDNWRAYAQASLRLRDGRPETGFGVRALSGWRHVDVTAHLLAASSPWLGRLPLGAVARVLRPIVPSFGFAWQRPAGIG
jgi:SAM-dependent methyltransferase